jgi:zinc transporter 1/2/3
MSDDGEAPILAAEDVESGEADPQEEHCHFHAGVESVLSQSPTVYISDT